MFRGKRIKGIEELERNINKVLKEIEGKTLKGLIRAGSYILRETEQHYPKTPVDLGNLRASRFMVTSEDTSIAVAGMNPNFKGKIAPRMENDHANIKAALGNIARAQKEPTVILGFSARYAMAVHEKINANVNWQRKASGPKFFERAIDRSVDNVRELVAKEASK